jgi:hypothetical protein
MAIQRITSFSPADRYVYDFKSCTYASGWAQIDTKQDASYYGNWTNPSKREIFTYCEGDTTLIRCDNDQEYQQVLHELIAWQKESGYWIGIDPGLAKEMRADFVRLGFADDLH